MKEHSGQSKEVLVFPEEEEFCKKNGIYQMSKVCDKFGNILKFFMYLQLTFFLIWIGYAALSEYTTVKTARELHSTMLNIDGKETTFQPTEELKTMMSKEEKKISNFLQILKDSMVDVDKSEDDSTTVVPLPQDTVKEAVRRLTISTTESSINDELLETTAASTIDDLEVSTSIIDSDVEDEKSMLTSERDAESSWNTFFNISNESSMSHSNEEVMDSPKFNATFNNLESFGIPSEEITEEDSSDETSEKLENVLRNLFLSQRSSSIRTHDEVDESILESTSMPHDTWFSSINLDDDTLDTDYSISEDAELIYGISEQPIGKNCKLSEEAMIVYISTGVAKWTCEPDENTSIDTENPLDLKLSTKVEYDYFDGFEKTSNYPWINADYFKRNYPNLNDELGDRKKVDEDEIKNYGANMKEYDEDIKEDEEKIKEESQGKNMEEEEKQDDVSEKVFDDINIEVTEDPSALSIESHEKFFPYGMVFGPISEVQSQTDLPSSIEIESSNNHDEIVSNEDKEFDKLWDELSPTLDSLQDDTLAIKPLPKEVEDAYVKILCTLLDATLQDMLLNPAFNITDEERLAINVERTIIQDAIGFGESIHDFTSISDFDHYMETKMDALHRDEWEENDKVKRSIENRSKNHENWKNRLMDEEKSQILRNAIDMETMILVQKMEQIDENIDQTLKSSLEQFFNRMELLSQHIDRLHERYLEFNELNDDYVSKEFPMESS